jgi:pyridoxine 4-dehydrogenase
VALAWLLAHGPVMLPIPGTSSVEHLEENVAAAELELTADELARLDTATASEPGAGSSPLAELGRR